MNSSKDSIIIQNIVKCSADLSVSSAEIDLLIAELFDNIALSQRSVWDIKNVVLQKYELWQKSYVNQRPQYDVLKERLIISRYISEKFKSYTEIDQSIFKKPEFVNIAYWYSNNYAKEAAESFAKMFKSCNKIQAESFAEVCELISDDITLGVVPVANSSDGRLISF